jgi:hypothetical protein
LAAVFFPAGVGVWHVFGGSDVILIEADRIHALGEKTATIRVDKPENAVTLIDTKESASAATFIGDSAPSGSLQLVAPTAG